MRFLTLLIGSLLFLGGCASRTSTEAVSDSGDPFTRYATGFRVEEKGDFRIVKVINPWQQSRDVIFTYLLAHDKETIPDTLSNIPFIKTPVKRVIALSTTHVAMIDQLGRAASIVGVSGGGYIYNPSISERISSGAIVDVGYGQGLDYEAIVRLDPDVIFLYGVEGNVVTILEKLKDLGIPAVFCGEYLESHPLGKAEWIRYFSLFYENEKESARFFNRVDSAYNALAAMASQARPRPRVLTGLPWKDTWFMAGGKSFAARLIEDAGGDYLWSGNSSSQAVPLDLESVYLKAVNADIWVNPGAAASMSDILLLDERFSDLPVVQEGRVYNNNARISQGGGNDYWESGTVRPDLVLGDLIKVFHPGLLSEHQFVYYRKLK
jgi:iron complex transport system substrate-binding protein